MYYSSLNYLKQTAKKKQSGAGLKITVNNLKFCQLFPDFISCV